MVEKILRKMPSFEGENTKTCSYVMMEQNTNKCIILAEKKGKKNV